MKLRKGFTIVELLMVITVIAVLLGIVTTAATASIRAARQRRAQAMRSIVQGGLDVYHRQKDEWPGAIESLASNGTSRDLTTEEYDSVMQELLRQSTGTEGKNPVMDPTGLMVMRAGSPNGKTTGVDYRTAVTETKTMTVKQMTVVYPISDTGKATRFTIHYNAASDSASVR